MTLPPPAPDNLQRQVALLRAMGGPDPVPGYTAEEMSRAQDRISLVFRRVAIRETTRPFERPRP